MVRDGPKLSLIMKTNKKKNKKKNPDYPAGRYMCYLKYIGSKEKCPWSYGHEGGFCEHKKCLNDNYY